MPYAMAWGHVVNEKARLMTFQRAVRRSLVSSKRSLRKGIPSECVSYRAGNFLGVCTIMGIALGTTLTSLTELTQCF